MNKLQKIVFIALVFTVILQLIMVYYEVPYSNLMIIVVALVANIPNIVESRKINKK